MYQVLRLLACINTSSVIKATWNCPFAQTVLFFLLAFNLSHMPSFGSPSMPSVASKHKKKAPGSYSQNTTRLPFIKKCTLDWKINEHFKMYTNFTRKNIYVKGENIKSTESFRRHTTTNHTKKATLCAIFNLPLLSRTNEVHQSNNDIASLG